jgi:hypothetical protein
MNQYNPYGSLQYYQDPNATDPDKGWSQISMLAPAQQALLDQQNKTSLGLGKLADRGLGYVDDALSNQITAASLPQDMVNAGETGYDALMRRINPQIETSRKALETKLANQGIMPGSEAYANSMRVQNEAENDMRSQASLHGIDIGQRAQTHKLGLLSSLQNIPVNMLNAVRTGSQVTNPTFGGTPQQQNAGGIDYSSALKGQSQYNMGLYNSQVAEANAGNSAAMSGAGTLAMGAALFF